MTTRQPEFIAEKGDVNSPASVCNAFTAVSSGWLGKEVPAPPRRFSFADGATTRITIDDRRPSKPSVAQIRDFATRWMNGRMMRGCLKAAGRRAVWLAAWLLLVTPAAALDANRKADSYSIQGWTTEQGLPSSKIRDVIQTRDGYLWITTAQGIARFDGNHFTVFSRATHPELGWGGFFKAIEAPDGTLWFSGNNGVYHLHNGHFDHFTTRDGLADNFVREMTLTPNGTIVACTHRGYSFISNGRITTPGGVWKQITGTARSYLELPDGSLLLGTSDGLWQISGEKIKKLSGPGGLPGTGFNCLLKTADGSVWIGSTRGLHRVLPNGTTQDYGTAQGLINPRVSALLMDREGSLWIGTYGGGVYRLAHGRIESATHTGQFGTTPVRRLLEDREGGLWVATATGLFRLKDEACGEIGRAEGLEQTLVYTVFEAHDGTWWIGLWGGGIYRYDQTKATHLAVPASLGLDEVLSLAEEPAGTLWIGAVSGLYRYSNGVITNLYHRRQAKAWRRLLAKRPDTLLPGLAHQRVNSITVDGAGGLWIATEGALYHERKGNFRAYTRADGLPGNDFKSVIRASNGDIWVTVPPEGVARLYAGQWTNYLCGEAISPIFPRAVYEDSTGTIWVTTEGGGLNRFKNGHWRTFTTRDGLADDFISGIIADKSGNLWLACPRGIMRLPLKQFDELEAGHRTVLLPRIFNQSDGLPAAEFNQEGSPNAWRTRDGRLLFATDDGVAVVRPRDVKINRLVPPVHIERFVINGRDADPTGPLIVPPGDNDVQIYYTAISLLAADKVRFKIQLAPLDRNLVDTGVRRDVRYAKLPPGHYTFHVTACNSDGIWNRTGATVGFVVQPFFYQTAWFTVLMVIFIGVAAFGLYWARTYRVRRQMAELERLVGERTQQLEAIHKQLLDASHRSGMAEIATNVLHNVGNVLNSVNVSACLIAEGVKKFKISSLAKVAALLREHGHDLGRFITDDPRGKYVPDHLTQLSEHLLADQHAIVGELDSLRQNIDHINEIVAMQQNYASVGGVKEIINVINLVEDSLRLNAGALSRHGVEVIREFENVPLINVEKHKILQILVNLVRNAKYACHESGRPDKRLTIRVTARDGRIRISVMDNGVGISRENLAHIFNHGFTTRKDGHGFGLHSSALAAKEMGGSLNVASDGPGQGVVVTLELPCPAQENPHE